MLNKRLFKSEDFYDAPHDHKEVTLQKTFIREIETFQNDSQITIMQSQ